MVRRGEISQPEISQPKSHGPKSHGQCRSGVIFGQSGRFCLPDHVRFALKSTLPARAGTCANCHGFDAKGFPPYTPALAGNPIVLDNDPSSLINLVLNGSNPLVVKGTPDPYRMPQFRLQYSDQEIADVVSFIRNGWGNQAPAVTAEQVAKLRQTTDPTSDRVIILKMR